MKQWRVFITPAGEKSVKTLPPPVHGFIFEEFTALVRENPLMGSQLSGPLSWLRSFHFSSDSKPYRVAYSMDVKIRKIIIHYAGHRGEFYERLRRHLRS